MNQSQIILSSLKRRKKAGLTRIDAFNLGVVELSARIGELEKAGHKIAHLKERRNKKNFTRYILVGAA